MLLVGWNVFFGIDCIGWVFGDVYGVVDVFVWIDGEKVGIFMEVIYWVYIYVICVFVFDVVFGYNVSY